ncbi:hypothetical protein MMIN_24500 [Mycolicibacter minnesotensis]|nr:hypothetical protein MMIN_24500 [Mycolicibacter minnesotensis]
MRTGEYHRIMSLAAQMLDDVAASLSRATGNRDSHECTLAFSETSVDQDHHFALGLAGFHDPMRFPDLIEGEDPRWRGLEPTRTPPAQLPPPTDRRLP